MARIGRRQPNRPIIVTGHPLGVPAVPTPLHPVRVVTRTARRAGRAIVTHGANVLGNKAASTPVVHAAKIVTGGARRGTGRIVLAHGVMAAAAVQPVAHPAQVHTQTARRPAGHVIVVRSPSLAASTLQPHVLSSSARRPGRIIVWRTTGAVGVPAQATRSPQVHAQTARRAGRTVVLGQHAAPAVARAAPNPQVHTSSARRPGVTLIRTGRPGLYPTTVAPITVTRSIRRAGRIVIVGKHAATIAVPVAGRQPQIHTTSTRRAGRILTVSANGGVTGPPTPGPNQGTVIAITALILTPTVTSPPAATPPSVPIVLGPSLMVVTAPAAPIPASDTAAPSIVLGPSLMVITR